MSVAIPKTIPIPTLPALRINEIVLGKRAVAAGIALRMTRFFEPSAEFWLGLQGQCDSDVTAAKLGERLKREVKTLVNAG